MYTTVLTITPNKIQDIDVAPECFFVHFPVNKQFFVVKYTSHKLLHIGHFKLYNAVAFSTFTVHKGPYFHHP